MPCDRVKAKSERTKKFVKDKMGKRGNKYTDVLKGKQMDAQEKIHNRILDKKWKSLEKRGYKKPRDSEENTKRAREAHGG